MKIFLIATHLRKVLKQIADKHKLPYEHVWVLIAVKGLDGVMTISKGIEVLSYSEMAVYKIVSNLTESGYLEVVEGSYPYEYRLTAKGSNILKGFTLLMNRAINGGK